MDHHLQTNLAHWNELTPIHARSAFYDLKGFKAGKSSLKPIEVRELGEVAGKSLLHLQCHFGMDTLSWARRGAQVVFHPHFHEAEPGGYRPSTFAEPANTFHEKAVLCRAAENTCYFATVNCASFGSPTTSAVANPDGTLLAYQPYGVEGLLVADLDLDAATGMLAGRCKYA